MWGDNLTWRTATSYDAVKAIALASENAATRDELQRILRESHPYIIGASGNFKFNDSGDRNFEPVLVKVKANPDRGYYFELLKNR